MSLLLQQLLHLFSPTLLCCCCCCCCYKYFVLIFVRCKSFEILCRVEKRNLIFILTSFLVRKRNHDATTNTHIYTYIDEFSSCPVATAVGLSIAFNAIRKQANSLIKRTKKKKPNYKKKRKSNYKQQQQQLRVLHTINLKAKADSVQNRKHVA